MSLGPLLSLLSLGSLVAQNILGYCYLGLQPDGTELGAVGVNCHINV